MKIVSSILKRAAVPALAVGLVVPALATPAAAQTPGSTAFRFFGTVGLSARAGFANNVTATVVGTNLRLMDTTGVAAGPGCSQVDFFNVNCPLPVSRLAVGLGDGGDQFHGTSIGIRTVVDAGSGADIVETGSGNDTIGVDDDTPNNDIVSTCGLGSDVVFANPGDVIGTGCEARYIS
ncbi:hypothetical protein ADL12_02815 [Streptomyces regalis]|uniref:DUF320 domain-containing protein n=2 Tax=Streptomyces regalis TaxID=68262 RepID=A0A0X3VPF7_9ACTN|nr:hypothetical protein ADL12_02815 [Streptomyces regalis]